MAKTLGLTIVLCVLACVHSTVFAALLPVELWESYTTPSTIGRDPPGEIIPGGTGLRHCGDAPGPADDLYIVERVEVSPRPLVSRNFTVLILGHPTGETPIAEDARVFVNVMAAYGGFLARGSRKLCDFATVSNGALEESCPPSGGTALMSASLHIMGRWPWGENVVKFDVRNGTDLNSARLFCAEGPIWVGYPTMLSTIAGHVQKAILPESMWIL